MIVNIPLATGNKLNCFISAREMLSIFAICSYVVVLFCFLLIFYMLINHLLENKKNICGAETLEIISQYKYIGLILTEHLDYLQMTKWEECCSNASQNVTPSRLLFFCVGNKGLFMMLCRIVLAVISGVWEICSNPCCGRGYRMVNTPAQTMAWCNENMAQDFIHGHFY